MTKELTKSQKNAILIILLSSSFITAMSTTVTVNMIPNLMKYFEISSGAAQWLTSGATLLSGIVIPITAFLIKKVPNKIYYMSAIGSFALGSFGAAIAGNYPFLLGSRLVQALGCGMLLPFAQVLILSIFPKEKHGAMMAAYSMAASVSSMVGPTYAGLLMDSVGWRGVFISLTAIGATLTVSGFIFMKNIIPKQAAVINMRYVALSSAAFIAVIVGLNNMSKGVFRLQSSGLMIIGMLLLLIFCKLQLASDNPMLNLRVFGLFSFRMGVLLTVCLYLIGMGNGIILPILAKTICGYSDTAYGFATIAGAFISVFATLFAGKIYDKIGLKPMAITSIVSFSVLTVLGLSAGTGISVVYVGMLYSLQSIGMAMLMSPTTTFALSTLDQKMRVDGSAIFNTLRQLASSMATTITVLLFTIQGSDLTAIHAVYGYYGVVTLCIVVLAGIYIGKQEREQ